MPRVCTICTHPQRAEIDKAIVDSEPFRNIAKRFQAANHAFTFVSLYRHKEAHIPEQLTKAKDAKEAAQADDLLSEIRTLQKVTQHILHKAIQADELRTALAAIREARGNTELLAKLLGELNDNPQVNIIVNPQWVQIRAVVVNALSPYPEARQAVAQALEEIETSC